MTREEKILSAINPATQLGIEIGPLNRPIVNRQMGKVRYVDHVTTEELKRKYAQDPSVDADQIVDVDYIWGEKRLPELAGDEAPFDYVVASHVIEHVPDLIGWLREIHAVLKPGGILTLAIPDKRYCFDYFRQPTEPAQVVEAYLLGSRKPSLRQIFEFHSQIVFWQGQPGWNHEVEPDDLARLYTDQVAWSITHQASIDHAYYDVHCWVFTPRTFFHLLRTLTALDLFDFKLVQYHEPTGCEFFVSLEAMDLMKNPDDRKAIQLESIPIIDRDVPQSSQCESSLKVDCDAPQDSQPDVEDASILALRAELEAEREARRVAEAQLREHQEKIRRLQEEHREKVQQLRQKISNLKARAENSENNIAAMQTSKFWQLRSYWVRLKAGLAGDS